MWGILILTKIIRMDGEGSWESLITLQEPDSLQRGWISMDSLKRGFPQVEVGASSQEIFREFDVRL